MLCFISDDEDMVMLRDPNGSELFAFMEAWYIACAIFEHHEQPVQSNPFNPVQPLCHHMCKLCAMFCNHVQPHKTFV